jgi:hypothetical protein
MALATRSKIRRLFAGRFTEKGEFIPQPGVMPRRYRCSCNPNGFVSGQAINHYKFCPFSSRNIEAFLGQESTFVLVTVALLVFALCGVSACYLGLSIYNL